MLSKNGWKIVFLIFLANALENVLLLYVVGVPLELRYITLGVVLALIGGYVSDKIFKWSEK